MKMALSFGLAKRNFPDMTPLITIINKILDSGIDPAEEIAVYTGNQPLIRELGMLFDPDLLAESLDGKIYEILLNLTCNNWNHPTNFSAINRNITSLVSSIIYTLTGNQKFKYFASDLVLTNNSIASIASEYIEGVNLSGRNVSEVFVDFDTPPASVDEFPLLVNLREWITSLPLKKLLRKISQASYADILRKLSNSFKIGLLTVRSIDEIGFTIQSLLWGNETISCFDCRHEEKDYDPNFNKGIRVSINLNDDNIKNPSRLKFFLLIILLMIISIIAIYKMFRDSIHHETQETTFDYITISIDDKPII